MGRSRLGLPHIVVSVALALACTAGPARADLARADVVQAVKNAFNTWAALDCVDLQFNFIDMDPLDTNQLDGIIVYFGHDATTWTHGELAYYSYADTKNDDGDVMEQGLLGLNARDFAWSIGAEAGRIDIETAVLHMIPSVLGFYVGPEPDSGSLSTYIKYDFVKHELDDLHETGAKYNYFKSGGSCTQPAKPEECGPGVSVGDGGTEAGPPSALCVFAYEGDAYHWDSQPIDVYIYVPGTITDPQPKTDGGTPTGDGSTPTGDGSTPTGDGGTTGDGGSGDGDDDDGCCRLAYTPAEHATNAGLLLLALVLFAGWRRRRR